MKAGGCLTAPGPVILGSGVAGLSAALSLSEAGLRPLVLERDGSSPGGRVGGKPPTQFNHAGRTWTFSMEHGIHGWWTPYRNFRHLLSRYGLLGELVPAPDQTLAYLEGTRVHRIHVGKRTQDNVLPEPFHHLPLFWDPRFVGRLRLSELPELLRVGSRVFETLRLDPDDGSHQRHYDAMSAADYARGLPVIFQHLMGCLTRSGFFADAEDVSLLAFMASLQFYVFLRRENQRFAFARGQIRERLIDPLFRAVERQGGQLVLGVTAEGISREQDGAWSIRWRRTSHPDVHHPLLPGNSGTLRAPSLVLAVDMEGARQLCSDSPDLARAYGDLSSLRGRPSAVVRHFWRGRPRDTASCGILAGDGLTADAYFWIDQFQDEFDAWAAATGGSVSECHVYDIRILEQSSDETLISGVGADLERTFPELRGLSVHAACVRNAPTNSSFAPGTLGALPRVSTGHPNLALAGDWIRSGSLSFFMERACHTGLLAANVVRAHHGKAEVPTHAWSPAPAHVRALQSLLRNASPVMAMGRSR